MDDLVAQAPALLSTTAPRWISLAQTLPVELLAREPAPGEWSALQCLRHLVDAERAVFPVRVQAFLAGRDFQNFDPDARGSVDAGRSPQELAAEFASLRSVSLEELSHVTSADLTRTARHSELGVVTLSELLHEWAAHDLMHTVQAERALMQPFLAGTGPWRFFFADHDAGGTVNT